MVKPGKKAKKKASQPSINIKNVLKKQDQKIAQIITSQVRHPSVKPSPAKHKGVPKGQSTFGKDMFAPRREHFLDLPGNTSNVPQVYTYPINAGNRLLFRKFSYTASPYNKCRLKYLKVHYESNMPDANATASPFGFVMVAINFDAAQPPFKSADQFFNYSGEQGAKPNLNFTYSSPHKKGDVNGIDVTRAYPVVLGYNTPVPPYDAGASALDYNVGTLQVAAYANSTTGIIGRLFVEYQWELIISQDVDTTLESSYAHWRGVPTTGDAIAGLVAVTNDSNFVLTHTSVNHLNVKVRAPMEGHVLQITTAVQCPGTYVDTLAPTFGLNTAAAAALLGGGYNYRSGSGSSTYMSFVSVGPATGFPDSEFNIIYDSPTVGGATPSSTDFFLSYVPALASNPNDADDAITVMRRELRQEMLSKIESYFSSVSISKSPSLVEEKSDDETVVVQQPQLKLKH